MAVTDLTDQCFFQVNGQPVDTSRISLSRKYNLKAAPFVGLDNNSSGLFRGVKAQDLEVEIPNSPEYPDWGDIPPETLVVTLLPRRLGCPKYAFQNCGVNSDDITVNNESGETVRRISWTMLRGGRVG